MVKQKNRYLLMEVMPEDEASTSTLTETEVFRALAEQISSLHGDYGAAATRVALQVKVCESSTRTVVVRIPVEEAQLVLTAAPFVRSIGRQPAVLRLLFTGASIRACEKRLIKIRRQELYAKLAGAKTGVERREIQEAIRQVTGNIIVV